MKTTLTVPPARRLSKARVLVIETDPDRAQALADLVRDYVGAQCSVFKNVQDAIRSIDVAIPDVVLTSMLLPPREVDELTASLRRDPAARHVQMVTVPYFIDAEAGSGAEPSTVLTFVRDRCVSGPPNCAPSIVARQIDAYVAQALEKRKDAAQTLRFAAASNATCTQADTQHVPRKPASVHLLGRPYANDRRRAPRRFAAELPGLRTVQLPSGAELRIIDVSTHGALLESGIKIAAGSATDLRLIGRDVNFCVPARMLRTEISAVDARGVRYRVAAAFGTTIELGGLEATAEKSITPARMVELLARVLRDGKWGTGVAARSKFEAGLRGLLHVQDVYIRRSPIVPAEGFESIYFTVPVTVDTQPILQAVFQPDYQPTADDLRLLKTAATLAAVLLESVPLCDASWH